MAAILDKPKRRADKSAAVREDNRTEAENARVFSEFTGIPRVVLPELHDGDTGLINAQKLADFIGVPLKTLTEGLGLIYKTVHRTPSAPASQKVLWPVKRSLEILREFMSSKESIRVWLNTPHPDLSGATAMETIMKGRADAVAGILESALNGVPV